MRTQRFARPGRSGRSQLAGGGAPAGPTYTSAAAPSVPGINSSGSDAIFPANWGGAVGDAFLMSFLVESTTGTAFSFAPSQGSIIGYTERFVGAEKMAHGLWWIPSYSGSGDPALNATVAGGTVTLVTHNILYWDVSLGSVKPTQIIMQNKAIGASDAATFTGSDGGIWTRTGAAVDGPAIFGITSGTNWIQGRSFAIGDEAIPTDDDAYYTTEAMVQTTGGSDGTIALWCNRAQAAVFGDGSGTIGHLDLGSALYNAAFFNVLMGT